MTSGGNNFKLPENQLTIKGNRDHALSMIKGLGGGLSLPKFPRKLRL